MRSAMTTDNTPHKPADDSEEVYYAGSPLLRGHVGRFFGFGIAGLVILAIPFLIQSSQGWPWLACVTIGLILIVMPALMARTVRYRISNYRIDYERGLLSKNIDTLELWHV